jgi:protein-S-isoprenylcysteine O-methyltransferase Ste14
MRLRLLVTKLLLLAMLPLLLLSRGSYPEGYFMDTILASAGLTLLLLAAGGRIWASLYLSGRKNSELVTEGPYSLVRNPLYLFSFIGFLGAGLVFESVILALLMAGIFAVGHWPTMLKEEEGLREIFGEAYEDYARRVPRFIPRIAPVRRPSELSVKTVAFSRALREASLIPMVFVVAHVLEWAKMVELIPVLIVLP